MNNTTKPRRFAVDREFARLVGAKGGRAGKGKPKTPGAVTLARMDELKAMRVGDSKDFPDDRKSVHARYYLACSKADIRVKVKDAPNGCTLTRVA